MELKGISGGENELNRSLNYPQHKTFKKFQGEPFNT
jgi:hypothetical protein